ncbi:uncharacterized protein LOC111518904 [Drosophila willistoni]|uniref:uncharacterized protein LOC111518904 n=1 Tax=Drosophila willistoni TaxID=7260 RepID=UPI001F077992|nr:uncharacterized protein LOC111518904 [Drosophila willistoni]
MSMSKLSNTRIILGTMTTNIINRSQPIRQHMSKPKILKIFKQQSATYIVVHASRASAAALEDMDEWEMPVPTEMPKKSTLCLPPKRTEQDQCRICKAQSKEAVKNLFNHELPKVQRLPFRPMPAVNGNVSSRRFANAEELLKVMDKPQQLAEEVINLDLQLSWEKATNKKLTAGCKDLLSELALKQRVQRGK